MVAWDFFNSIWWVFEGWGKTPGALASDFPERLKRFCLESHHRYHPQAFVCGGFCDHRHCKGQRYCCYILLGFWRSHFCPTTGGTFCLEDVHLKGNRKVNFVHAILYRLNKSFWSEKKHKIHGIPITTKIRGCRALRLVNCYANPGGIRSHHDGHRMLESLEDQGTAGQIWMIMVPM